MTNVRPSCPAITNTSNVNLAMTPVASNLFIFYDFLAYPTFGFFGLTANFAFAFQFLEDEISQFSGIWRRSRYNTCSCNRVAVKHYVGSAA